VFVGLTLTSLSHIEYKYVCAYHIHTHARIYVYCILTHRHRWIADVSFYNDESLAVTMVTYTLRAKPSQLKKRKAVDNAPTHAEPLFVDTRVLLVPFAELMGNTRVDLASLGHTLSTLAQPKSTRVHVDALVRGVDSESDPAACQVSWVGSGQPGAFQQVEEVRSRLVPHFEASRVSESHSLCVCVCA
jgi:hypothetical protein